jgi:Aspartyl protease
MADTLTFEISYLYVDSTEGIAIPVALVAPNGIYNTWAKVDTGAEVCLVSNEVGLRLGLDVERGTPRNLGSAGGTMIDSFGHEVVIQTFGIAMSSIIYFAKLMPSPFLC